MKKIRVAMVAVALALVGSAFLFTASGAEDDPTTLWEGYQSWYSPTKDNPNTGDPTGFLKGKHKGKKAYREIYVNSVGAARNKGEASGPYPEGTVVVKEAYGSKKAWDAKKKPELTVMVKLAKGSAPTTGDWEMFMGGSGKKRGAGTNTRWGKFCGNCHINAAATDYVFTTK